MVVTVAVVREGKAKFAALYQEVSREKLLALF